MTSIRGFLITLLLSTIVLTIFLSVLQGYQTSNKEIQQQMDAKLIELAKLLSDLHISNESSVDARYKTIHKGEKFAFQIISTEQVSSPERANSSEQAIAPLKQKFDEVNFNGYRWRSYALFNDKEKVWVIVAERIDIRFDLAERTLLKSLTPIILGLPFAAVLIWFIVGYALKPLSQLSTSLKNKRENDLSPLEIKKSYKEVEQVIQSSNKLLKRLSSSFAREKHFASDVAHELRTPLSVLKLDLFNLNKKRGSNHQDLQDLNQSVNRMEHLVQQILTLYRTTPDQFMMTFSIFNLTALTKRVIAENYKGFDKKSQSIELQGDKSYALEGDSSAIAVLLVNLITNANKYTPEGGSIRVNIDSTTDSVILQVEDSGAGIPKSEYERVFERFYRQDGDCHSSSEQGCGLGLPIVKHIVDLHKATISLHRSSFTTGLMVQVAFPSAGRTRNEATQ